MRRTKGRGRPVFERTDCAELVGGVVGEIDYVVRDRAAAGHAGLLGYRSLRSSAFVRIIGFTESAVMCQIGGHFGGSAGRLEVEFA